MSITGTDEGLRARKRAATHENIERTAIALALEHGYEHVTVEMICEASMVSPRTFFNYFGSKEGVALGSSPAMPPEEDIQRFVTAQGTDVLGDLVELITAALVGHTPDPELLRSRRMLIQRTPELVTGELARMGQAEDALMRIIMRRFQAQGRSVEATPDLEDEARMVIALTTGVMHSAMRKWFSSDFAGTPEELLRGSIDLIRRITSNAQAP